MNTYIIFGLLGNCLSSLVSCLVIIQLCLIKYKDLSNKLLLIFMPIDLAMGIVGILMILPINIELCSATIWLLFIIRDIHRYFVLLISIVMYLNIVKSKPISKIFLIFYSIFCAILTIIKLAVFFSKAEMIIYNNLCFIYPHTNEIENWLIIIDEIAPDIIIFIIIAYLNNKIRLTLISEAINCNIISTSKRFFAKRLIGYGFVFTLFFVPLCIILIVVLMHAYTDKMLIDYMMLEFYSWYPLFNTMIYGCTKSFKRNLFNFIIPSPDFDTQEEILNLMREENFLKPRFYLDMMSISDSVNIREVNRTNSN
ncbi:hypothetical protein SteCoe_15391 [Stentor coeruleus]|uniref:G-protein coupled receptors family 1 profile domain-containing protein n=1 Tax=Stentor coeruleus TaxID=5963 RepID=A0A1R2C3R2_9CILI|nr:hypothetical protein SteCoe_15391 [Stentor coeruleus]